MYMRVLHVCLYWTYVVQSLPDQNDDILRLDPAIGPLSTNHLPRFQLRNRLSCNHDNAENRPKNTELLSRLRTRMHEKNLYGIIAVNGDEHEDENIHVKDKRASLLTGYYAEYYLQALVTTFEQVVFVRDKEKADATVDCSWQVEMSNEGRLNTWLLANVPEGMRIGAYPNVIDPQRWVDRVNLLNASGISLVAIDDLIQEANVNVAAINENLGIYPHDVQYAGQTWHDKIDELLRGMADDVSDALVITTVDDIAWLFNLRGAYYSNAPLFPAFAVIIREDSDRRRPLSITLYIRESDELDDEVKKHLELGRCDVCVTVKEYKTVYADLKRMNSDTTIKNILVDRHAKFSIVSQIDGSRIRSVLTPVALMKVEKNDVQIENMKRANIRDAVGVIRLLTLLERRIAARSYITEMDAVQWLTDYRRQDPLNRGEAFPTISGFGPNGAIIHYTVDNSTNLPITEHDIYLLDTGGQYLDGTIDMTRTVHFGTPTSEHRELYSRVLLGVVDTLSMTWVAHSGKPEWFIVLARKALWEIGMDYPHGSGHGVGQFSNVHEDPINFFWTRNRAEEGDLADYVFRPGTVQAIEPGVYLYGKFGIRLETMVVVAQIDNETQDSHLPKNELFPIYRFEPIYLMPFESKLMKLELFSSKQIAWINKYHARCLAVLGPELLGRNLLDEYRWLKEKTAILINVHKRVDAELNSSLTDSAGTKTILNIVIIIAMLAAVF